MTATLALAILLSVTAPALSVGMKARALQPGELVLLTIRGPAGIAAPSLTAFGREQPVFAAGPGTWRGLVGIDLDVTPGTYPVLVSAEADGVPLRRTVPLRVRKKRFAVRRLRVDEAFVAPPEQVRQRIADEAAELGRLFSTTAPERSWSDGFVAPVRERSSGRFGSRSVFNGEPRSPHSGADFPSPAGTPVHAPNAGRVVLAKPLYFSGNTVVLDHGLGVFSVLAHLSTIDVTEGDEVSRGSVLGRVGATGRVTGPHLHWAVRVAEARVDPLSLLAVLGRK